MELNKLEATFFNEILNAELDVPVHATLKYEGTAFEIIVVPEIAPEGYFRLNYFNAHPYDPKPQVSDQGTSSEGLPIEEALGLHPLLARAQCNWDVVELALKPSPLPMQPELNRTVNVKVMRACVRHRGELVLDGNQMTLDTSPLKMAEFSISRFCDFVSFPRRVVLDTGDGWKITLTKDEKASRGAVSHTGVVEKSNGSDFEVNELRDTLEGLRYFFAFTTAIYCYPSVIISYDANGRVTWGEAGQFRSEGQRPRNWFQHGEAVPSGGILERFFPKFWRKWKAHRDELIAVIDCYASSEAMRQVGMVQDSVAKSCAGLEILAGLVRGQTILGNAGGAIDQVLKDLKIPRRYLDATKNPVTHKLCSDLSISDNGGASLLVKIRNYIVHPLGKNTVVKPGPLQYVDGDKMRYVHLHNLSQFYLEYMLLRFCGHNVAHYRRLREDRN